MGSQMRETASGNKKKDKRDRSPLIRRILPTSATGSTHRAARVIGKSQQSGLIAAKQVKRTKPKSAGHSGAVDKAAGFIQLAQQGHDLHQAQPLGIRADGAAGNAVIAGPAVRTPLEVHFEEGRIGPFLFRRVPFAVSHNSFFVLCFPAPIPSPPPAPAFCKRPWRGALCWRQTIFHNVP